MLWAWAISSSRMLVRRRIFPVKARIFLFKIVQCLKDVPASYKTSMKLAYSVLDQNVNKLPYLTTTTCLKNLRQKKHVLLKKLQRDLTQPN
ncbi:protein of unknown function [Candidatus Nitrosotalea okcheonensis]|uniref:Uncharacterized protein n=1 Tax=Candidatus Nitrosotalea okcheonensis TaxID=1903276 RepID=A0A2H1FC42_9ARCH|nr:protein of unknown function [Candidatus Nitrosotalea okcheonensis]